MKRADCYCAGDRQPCSYHEGWEDALAEAGPADIGMVSETFGPEHLATIYGQTWWREAGPDE